MLRRGVGAGPFCTMEVDFLLFQYGLTFPLLMDRTWPIKITIIGQYSIIYIPVNMD